MVSGDKTVTSLKPQPTNLAHEQWMYAKQPRQTLH